MEPLFSYKLLVSRIVILRRRRRNNRKKNVVGYPYSRFHCDVAKYFRCKTGDVYLTDNPE